MNADRLHALLLLLRDDLQTTGLANLMQQLSRALQVVIQQPHQNHHEAVGNALKAVEKAIEKSRINQLSPVWIEMIKEIGFFESLGARLKEQLDEAFTRIGVTPTLVRETVDLLSAQINKLQEAVNQGIAAFTVLSIGAEQLGEGDCELGFVIPREAIKSKLEAFSKECKEFELIFSTFSEVVTGHRDQYRIRTISSSDLSVFLAASPFVALAIAKACERILAAYKQMLEIKKLRRELAAQEVPDEALAKVEEHTNAKMDKVIEELSIEIINECSPRHKEERSNELGNALRISLRKLANRIDRGFHIEVRVGALPKPSDDKDRNANETKACLEKIQQLTIPLQFIKTEGPPILSLPESTQSAPAKKPKKSKVP